MQALSLVACSMTGVAYEEMEEIRKLGDEERRWPAYLSQKKLWNSLLKL